MTRLVMAQGFTIMAGGMIAGWLVYDFNAPGWLILLILIGFAMWYWPLALFVYYERKG